MTMHRQELYRTGGGPSAAPAFNDVEEKVLAICSNISGLDARNDSDNFIDKTDATVPPLVVPTGAELTPQDIDAHGINEMLFEASGMDQLTFTPLTEEVQETLIENNNQHLEEVMEECADYHGDKLSDHEKHDGFLKDSQHKWGTWNPKSLKTKKSLALQPNPNKTSVTAKLDQLSAARLELVQLQKEIANKEHLFVKEEHELKMLHLRNEEMRKQQLHELMLIAMKAKSV